MNLHQQTDQQLAQKNKELKKQYQEAYKDIKYKVLEEYGKLGLNAEMTEQEKLKKSKRFVAKMTELISSHLVDTNKNAVGEVNKQLNNFYQENYNGTIQSLKEQGIDGDKITKKETKEELENNPNPFNVIAVDNLKDKNQTQRKVQDMLFTAVLGGFNLTMLKKLFEDGLRSVMNILTTQGTRMENMAMYDALLEMQPDCLKEGYSITKVWISQKDEKVRDAHARADGQEVDIDRPFYVNGEALMYPADMSGSPANIINCRCYMQFYLRKVA